jgi:hypothetical protein
MHSTGCYFETLFLDPKTITLTHPLSLNTEINGF